MYPNFWEVVDLGQRSAGMRCLRRWEHSTLKIGWSWLQVPCRGLLHPQRVGSRLWGNLHRLAPSNPMLVQALEDTSLLNSNGLDTMPSLSRERPRSPSTF